MNVKVKHAHPGTFMDGTPKDKVFDDVGIMVGVTSFGFTANQAGSNGCISPYAIVIDGRRICTVELHELEVAV